MGRLCRCHHLPNQLHSHHRRQYLPRECPRHQQQCSRQIEQQHIQRPQQSSQLKPETIVAVCRRAVLPVRMPLAHSFLLRHLGERRLAQHHLRVASVAVLVHKHVVCPVGDIVMVDETVFFQKQTAIMSRKREKIPKRLFGIKCLQSPSQCAFIHENLAASTTCCFYRTTID